jgi:DNA-binding transcriptional LysR family regulator
MGRGMDFRQLRYFTATVEQRSMSAAARICRVSQPTLSTQISDLEVELNETLFKRVAFGVRPTPAAQAFYRRLAPVLSDAIHALRYIRSSDVKGIQDIAVAIDQSAASLLSLLVGRAARQIEAKHPHLRIAHCTSESTMPRERTGIRLSHRIGKPAAKTLSFSDRWVFVEIGAPRGSGARGVIRGGDLSQFDGYIDVPRLSNEIRAALAQWSDATTPILMNMTDEDAGEVIASILANNRGRALLPLLALKPDALKHPRLRISDIDAGLPPLHVAVEMFDPPDTARTALVTALVKPVRMATLASDPPPVLLPDARQLRYFLRVLEEGTISRAAVRLNIVQPAVSMQIRALERTLGGALIDRTHQGVSATDFGRKVRNIFTPMMMVLQDVNLAASSDRKKARQVLRVGTLPGLNEESLLVTATTATVMEWRAAFPNIELRVVEAYSGVLLEWLTGNQIDIAVVEDMHGLTSFKETVLSSEPLAILTSAKQAICAPGPIDMSELSKLNLVLPSPRHGLRALLDRKFAEAGLQLVPKLQLDSMLSAMRLVKAGGWATVMPSSAVRQDIDDGVLVAHPIVRPVIARELRSVQLARNPKRSWENEFIRLLRARLTATLLP